jgi:hypothetical protein
VGDTVSSLAVFDNGSGPALYAGGIFRSIGGAHVRRIAKWDGSSWSALGNGVSLLTGAEDGVTAMEVFDDGSGPALYVAGDLRTAGTVTANRIARWNGATWSAVGSGMVGQTTGDDVPIRDLTVFDDGSGPALYACGDFTSAGNAPATNRIARWNGSSWSSVGGAQFSGRPWSMVVFDDGTGPALYVATGDVWKWNGATWSLLPEASPSQTTLALAVFDDGDGPALHAGGAGLLDDPVVKWNGMGWSGVGSAAPSGVHSMAVFDDGEGPALFVGGRFTSAGGLPANRVAKWNGSSWAGVGSGFVGTETTTSPSFPAVLCFAVFQDRKGTGLFAGGELFSNPDAGDSYVARWGCPDTLAPVLDCPPPLIVLDPHGSSPGEFVTFAIAATDDVDPVPDVVCEPPSGSFFPRGTTLVSCTATDASGNQSTCELAVTVRASVRVPVVQPVPYGR